MKKILYKCCLIILFLFLSSTVCYGASGINSNEQEIINKVKAGFMVDGKYYTVDTKYINQGINYLNQDGVNITNEQKSMIFAKMEELAPQGVARGYLKQSQKEQEKTNNSNKAADGKGSSVDNKGSKESVNNGKGNYNSESDESNDISLQDISQALSNDTSINNGKANSNHNLTIISLEELIKSAKEISSKMGVSVSYDLSKNEVKVIDQKGKAVMSAETVIKNTGFRFNDTLIIGFTLITLVMACIIFAKFSGLFKLQEEENKGI